MPPKESKETKTDEKNINALQDAECEHAITSRFTQTVLTKPTHPIMSQQDIESVLATMTLDTPVTSTNGQMTIPIHASDGGPFVLYTGTAEQSRQKVQIVQEVIARLDQQTSTSHTSQSLPLSESKHDSSIAASVRLDDTL